MLVLWYLWYLICIDYIDCSFFIILLQSIYINSYDIETFVNDKSEHVSYCIVYKFKKKIKEFYYNENKCIVEESILSIFNENLNKTNKNIFYIHNLDYDGIFILNYLSGSKLKFKTFIRNMQIYSIEIEKESYKIEFKCSYKILPSSLSKIAKSFNILEKLIFPYNFSKKENLNYIGEIPNFSYFNSKEDFLLFIKFYKKINFNFREYSIMYCKRDVEITSVFMEKIKEMIEIFKIPLSSVYSAPSLSLKIFIKKFNKNKIITKYNDLSHRFIKNAYYGGRCEVYGNPINGEYIHHFDFSGMYGMCMLEKFAFGKYSFFNNAKNFDKPGFYCIKFISNSNIPILPHHSIKENKLMFTNGCMIGFYWFEEILLFLKNGGIVEKILYCILFENYDYVFKDFIDFFDIIRKKGNDYKTFAKLMINSLYGRLGMDQEETYSFFINSKDIEIYEKKFKILKKKELNNLILIEILLDNSSIKKLKIKKPNIKSNIAIAAAITSKARIKLFNAQKSVILSKGRLLYSDTDSIFASYKKNMTGKKIGDVTWDNESIKDAFFINPKSYAILYDNTNEIIKIKGINRKNITFEELKKKFYNNDDLIINNFMFLEKDNFLLKNITIEKKINLSYYNKRKFINNKKETIPYELKNNEYL